MNVIIIEDEPQAAKRLETLLSEVVPEARVLARIDSVKKAVAFFSAGVVPDLALMDIQLSDGISFDIFNQCQVRCPIIFTTAYDEYALKAFKVNSIDYILKPVDKEEFVQAIAKFRASNGKPTDQGVLENIQEVVRMLTKKYKTRFVIKVGEHLRTIEVNNVLYFYSQEKTTFCCTDDGRKHILDYTLEDLEEMVDPVVFFRINRKYLVSASSFTDIIHYTNSRLKLVLKGSSDNDVVVAREKVQEFKTWLDR
jgi:DNA-binding LytR/AlgR family response regulator